MRKPTAILTGDIGLRADMPVARVDDFLAEQERKLTWLRDLQIKYDCPVLDSGDVFDNWKSPPWLLSMAIRLLPDRMITVPGNHDLPGHSLELLSKSSLAVVEAANRIKVLKPGTRNNIDFIDLFAFPWGVEPESMNHHGSMFKVAICHIMTYQGDQQYPGCKDSDATRLLKKLTGYDLILTGHNHQSFVEQDEDGRLLVNPGSLMRENADQIDHKPRVYLWYAEEKRVEPVYVPIKDNVLSREHLVRKEEKNLRMEAFIEKLNGGYEISMSFEKNIESHFQNNKTRQSVKDIVLSSMEG